MSESCAGSSVPDAEMDCVIVPVPTLTFSLDLVTTGAPAADEVALLAASQAPPPTAKSTRVAASTISSRF